MIAVVLFGLFVLFLVIQVPIAVALGFSAIITIIIFQLAPLLLVPQILFGAVDSFTLLAIPFFILAGYFFARGSFAEDISNLFAALTARIKGGFGIAVVITAIFVAGISGSGPADVAALSLIFFGGLTSSGYSKEHAAALLAAGGGIGIIVPPSIALIIYGSVAQVSVSKLFFAGIFPGIIIGLALIVLNIFLVKEKGDSVYSRKNILRLFVKALPAFFAPVIILGGIYFGVFSPTESAVVAVLYALVMDLVYYKKMRIDDYIGAFSQTINQSAVILFSVMNATLFAWVLTSQNIISGMAAGLIAFAGSKIIALLLMNLILLILGMFIDAISIFYIVTPLLLILANKFNINLLHLGIIMTVNLAIGQITPPIGVNLFTVCSVQKLSISKVAGKVLYFVFAEIAVLLLVTFVPEISLYLTRFIR